jgi:hypothetical protein
MLAYKRKRPDTSHLRSKLHIPGALKDPEICSTALAVHRSQVEEANAVAQRMGCGTPFASDGTFVGRRSEVKRYVSEINRRRGEGEARLVNFDGGYGDPT